jgi:hypothetical protein
MLGRANGVPKVVKRLNHLATGMRLQLDFLGLLIDWQGLE